MAGQILNAGLHEKEEKGIVGRDAIARYVIQHAAAEVLIVLDNPEWNFAAETYLHGVDGMAFVDFVGLRRRSHPRFQTRPGVAFNTGTSLNCRYSSSPYKLTTPPCRLTWTDTIPKTFLEIHGDLFIFWRDMEIYF